MFSEKQEWRECGSHSNLHDHKDAARKIQIIFIYYFCTFPNFITKMKIPGPNTKNVLHMWKSQAIPDSLVIFQISICTIKESSSVIRTPAGSFLVKIHSSLMSSIFHLKREDHGHHLEKETQQQSILEDDRCGRSRRREDDDLRTRGRQDHEDNQPNIITQETQLFQQWQWYDFCPNGHRPAHFLASVLFSSQVCQTKPNMTSGSQLFFHET